MQVQFTDELQGVPFLDVIVYGNAKVGKTRFASTFPKPFFISFAEEEGLESLRGQGKIPYVQISSIKELAETYKYIVSQLGSKDKDKEIEIQTIVIDSLTSLWDLIVDEKVGKENAIDSVKIDWDTRTALNNHLFFFHRKFKALKQKYNVNVVFVAHTDEKNDGEAVLRRIGVGSITVAKHLAKNTNYILYLSVENDIRKLRLTADEQFQSGVRSEAGIEVPSFLLNDDVNYDKLIQTLGFKRK